MLQALGFRLNSSRGEPIAPGAKGLSELAWIDTETALPELKECRIQVACDVNNPLCGVQGASAVFGPQKGAEPYQISLLDSWMRAYASKAADAVPNADPDFPGAGAAGGTGFALRTFLGAELCPGAVLLMEALGIASAIQQADLVLTGEGRIDAQTTMGKIPAGIAAAAKQYGKPVVALCGTVGPGAEQVYQAGIDACFSVLRQPMSLEQALNQETAQKNIADTAEQILRLWQAAKK